MINAGASSDLSTTLSDAYIIFNFKLAINIRWSNSQI